MAFTRIRSQIQWHFIQLGKELHTELAEHISYYSSKQIVGGKKMSGFFLFTVDLVAI